MSLTELGVVSPHAVHDDSQFAGDCNDSSAAAFSAHQSKSPTLDL
jgi:hypothetical protein